MVADPTSSNGGANGATHAGSVGGGGAHTNSVYATNGAGTFPPTRVPSRALQFCTFEVVDLLIGIDVHRVQEVIREQLMTHVPLAPPGVQGLINLRGRIVTALDLRSRLELPPRSPGVRVMNAVVRKGDEVVSLLVDRTRDVVEPPEEAFEPVPPTASAVIRKMCTGTYKLDSRLLLVLDVDAVLNLPHEGASAYKYPDWVAGLDLEQVLHLDGR